MEKELISKKDLLELTGISYGQLYRWKRKNLIPEEWFIRKSTYTGQETFFPKEQILDRVEKIKSMKDDLSLDEIADMFSTVPTTTTLAAHELIKRNIVSEASLQLYTQQFAEKNVFTFKEALHVYILDKLLSKGEISLEEGKALLQVLRDHYEKVEQSGGQLVFIRKMGVTSFILAQPGEIYFEDSVRVVVTLNLLTCIEECKMKWHGGEAHG
ncbi:YhbD family protein [Laceyella putida]|uniref:YhbD family protein n=1 Tax=Laceyella putida TaxID=110101 RepID=A0ABW2RPL4_9BACL